MIHIRNKANNLVAFKEEDFELLYEEDDEVYIRLKFDILIISGENFWMTFYRLTNSNRLYSECKGCVRENIEDAFLCTRCPRYYSDKYEVKDEESK